MSCQDDVQADFDTAVNMTAGYVHRHLAQRPAGDISDPRWRYSLINWGHGPCK